MKEVIKLLKSFAYAGRGIFDCAVRERNFRIHIVAVLTVTIFAVIYGVTKTEGAVLALTMSLVVSLEAMNTAVESAVNLASDKRSDLARLAKDTAAGAVLAAAIGSVAVAVLVFGDAARLIPAALKVLKYWYLAAAYIIIMAVFVFAAAYEKRRK